MNDVEGLMALADAGDVNAAYLVGLHFYCADPGEDDPVASARWFQLAVEGGHNDAKFYLAQQYEHGEGVPVDLARAIQLYEQAASAGSGDAYARGLAPRNCVSWGCRKFSR